MITEGHLGRHYQGQAGGRGPALIDIAQDHALKLLADADVFELGVVFKGGTALRKFRAGAKGRFSTDLDFAGAAQPAAELLLEALDGAEFGPFRFHIEPLNNHRRSLLHIDSPFGVPEVPARIDCSPRAPWIPAEILRPLEFPVHRSYGFELAPIPVMTIEEVLSEKLARYRRASLVRDLYDLAWAARIGRLDDPLIRRLTVLKVWHDVVEDKLGQKPFDPDDVLAERSPNAFAPEDIGLLTTDIDVRGWISAVQGRFDFLRDLDNEELAVAVCNPGEAHRVSQLVAQLQQTQRSDS